MFARIQHFNYRIGLYSFPMGSAGRGEAREARKSAALEDVLVRRGQVHGGRAQGSSEVSVFPFN